MWYSFRIRLASLIIHVLITVSPKERDGIVILNGLYAIANRLMTPKELRNEDHVRQ